MTTDEPKQKSETTNESTHVDAVKMPDGSYRISYLSYGPTGEVDTELKQNVAAGQPWPPTGFPWQSGETGPAEPNDLVTLTEAMRELGGSRSSWLRAIRENRLQSHRRLGKKLHKVSLREARRALP